AAKESMVPSFRRRLQKLFLLACGEEALGNGRGVEIVANVLNVHANGTIPSTPKESDSARMREVEDDPAGSVGFSQLWLALVGITEPEIPRLSRKITCQYSS